MTFTKTIRMKFISLFAVLLLSFCTASVFAQISTQWGPNGFIKIEEGSGGFTDPLDAGDRFGRDHDQAGDINGDGIIDLVVGARSDDDGVTDAGAVYILFMNNDGTVQSSQKISATQGGFTETLLANNFFGYGVAGIGDYDGDNIPDIAVSAPASTNIALYIIHLNSNGTVKNFVKNSNIIAQGLSAVGDLNNDGRIDLVACDPRSNQGGVSRGAIQLLFFDATSHVVPANSVHISSTRQLTSDDDRTLTSFPLYFIHFDIVVIGDQFCNVFDCDFFRDFRYEVFDDFFCQVHINLTTIQGRLSD